LRERQSSPPSIAICCSLLLCSALRWLIDDELASVTAEANIDPGSSGDSKFSEFEGYGPDYLNDIN
jgi:hypothetical protein